MLDIFAEFKFFSDTFEYEDIGVDSHADGEDECGDAGEGEGGFETGLDAEDDEDISEESDDGDDAEGLVVKDHEEDDEA